MREDSWITTRRGPGGVVGGLVLAGRTVDSQGVPAGRTIRFGSFGMTYVTQGYGDYRDEHRVVPLGPGSLIFVFPGHPHWYGPAPRTTWDEAFLVFDGPMFQMALESGLHSVDTPVHLLTPVVPWLQRIERFRTRPARSTQSACDAEACEILKLIIEIRAGGGPGGTRPTVGTDWYSRSCSLLDSDLGASRQLHDVADDVGIPYETWRRYFRRRSGYSPARYRLVRRLAAAATMLDETAFSTREIAALLGFSDEHHLIRHFRSNFGCTPRRYRDRNN